ncbi:D-aminoacyl-tRNA deacylase [Dokdonia sp. 4H-3-7-5]|uniref:D-aminoacyl-tRNA deacylase n=1 Tax=Dokdonia sp. (strain 4H-3-7-5) TaxID=983548 RepID=UPI00020A69D1|nr:D-aminoacyl-tRNA deacylase [Dokdonia sp. 4H-3-7-5]AEE18486.1 D-tyrosyl-tRNA(Tyr) deacylase [Dokdonia sp. 4H-3-7-5]
MKAVIQRVTEASVTIDGIVKSEINQGLLVLLGVTHDDTINDIEWLTNKIIGLRIFSDNDGAMNLSVGDVDGDILVISQFTLYASTKKGNRPSFLEAARPDKAIPMYEEFVSTLSRKRTKPTYTGEFGADMKVQLLNDGPVTIVIDTKNRI